MFWVKLINFKIKKSKSFSKYFTSLKRLLLDLLSVINISRKNGSATLFAIKVKQKNAVPQRHIKGGSKAIVAFSK